MGTTASKFRKQIEAGEEFAALNIYQKHADLRKALHPNVVIGTDGNTFVHLAARHGMKTLLRLFLTDHGGNPCRLNSRQQTALHCCCDGSQLTASIHRRAECLSMILGWRGDTIDIVKEASSEGSLSSADPTSSEFGPSEMMMSQVCGIEIDEDDCRERLDINSEDSTKNTALHYAAMTGLKRCVEILVFRGADLYIENESRETACDLAEKSGYLDIAEYLETKMVFSHERRDSDLDDEDEAELYYPIPEIYSGLREHDLRESKDQLLVTTADMLHVPLFTAEALLRNHEWSREELLECWMRDPVACCERSGAEPPTSLLEERAGSEWTGEELTETQIAEGMEKLKTKPPPAESVAGHSGCREDECSICTRFVSYQHETVNTACDHIFCNDCWQSYLTSKIDDGDPHSISCPSFGCDRLVPVELIEKLVSPTVARKFLKFDIKAFVDSNPCIEWCPSPGCNNAVKLPDGYGDHDSLPQLRAFPRLQPPPPTSRTVFCPAGHAFCWDCHQDGHEPTCCEKWHEWHEKIAVVKPESSLVKGTHEASETAANCLWLVTHSKPCPKCKSPIQKNEGCNHMKCSKCKHDFCWVCLGPWKKHSTDTGGYFRCNRYDDTRKLEEKTDAAVQAAKQESKRTQELNRFVHYYSRYKNHLNSFDMEKTLIERIPKKVEHLSRQATIEEDCESASGSNNIDMTFVTEAATELLRSRRVLSSSYAYGYYLKDFGYNKTIFEYLQNELELACEALSGMVSRSYLRNSCRRIRRATAVVKQRRHTFLSCITRGLLPPETPPALRRSRNKKGHLPGLLGIDAEDEDWAKSGLPAPDDVDPNQPWVKDARGRHRNMVAMLDWPNDFTLDDEDDEDGTPSVAPTVERSCGSVRRRSQKRRTSRRKDKLRAMLSGSTKRILCQRSGCTRPRAINPRTGQPHAHCSLLCKQASEVEQDQEKDSDEEERTEYNVDLMIALQISRLQLLRDLDLLEDYDVPPVRAMPAAYRSHIASVKSSEAFGEDIDPDIQLAIERSIEDNGCSTSQSSAVAEQRCAEVTPPPQVVQLLLRRFTEKKNNIESKNVLRPEQTTPGKVPKKLQLEELQRILDGNAAEREETLEVSEPS